MFHFTTIVDYISCVVVYFNDTLRNIRNILQPSTREDHRSIHTYYTLHSRNFKLYEQALKESLSLSAAWQIFNTKSELLGPKTLKFHVVLSVKYY